MDRRAAHERSFSRNYEVKDVGIAADYEGRRILRTDVDNIAPL